MFENLRRVRPERTESRSRLPDTPPPDAQRSSRSASNELTRCRKNNLNYRSDSPPPQPLSKRLTSTLLESNPAQFEAATRHPFLQAAGQGQVTKHELSRWLSQDRLYAETYIAFITSLITRVPLPFSFIENKDASLRWRIINLLTGCLDKIRREIEFFTKTANEYGLSLDQPWEGSGTFGPNAITEQYISLFNAFHLEPQQTLLDGLLVLWATEKCYLEAWTYASIHMPQDVNAQSDADSGALRNEFIPNWSSKEFDDFVRNIADITDELAQREGAFRKIETFKALWLHVLEIEKGFWPDVDVSI